MRTDQSLVADGCHVLSMSVYMARWRPGAHEYCQTHGEWVRTCKGCGMKFHTKRRHAETCSNKCRVKVSRSKV